MYMALFRNLNMTAWTLLAIVVLGAEQAQALLEKVERKLSKRGRDVNSSEAGTGGMGAGSGFDDLEEHFEKQPEEG